MVGKQIRWRVKNAQSHGCPDKLSGCFQGSHETLKRVQGDGLLVMRRLNGRCNSSTSAQSGRIPFKKVRRGLKMSKLPLRCRTYPLKSLLNFCRAQGDSSPVSCSLLSEVRSRWNTLRFSSRLKSLFRAIVKESVLGWDCFVVPPRNDARPGLQPFNINNPIAFYHSV